MAAIAVSLVAFGTSAMAVTVLLAFWGLIATAAPVGWWTWMSKVLPDQAEAGGGLMVAVIQLAITVGASVGGLLFDGSGYRATFGAALSFSPSQPSSRSSQRGKPPCQPPPTGARRQSKPRNPTEKIRCLRNTPNLAAEAC